MLFKHLRNSGPRITTLPTTWTFFKMGMEKVNQTYSLKWWAMMVAVYLGKNPLKNHLKNTSSWWFFPTHLKNIGQLGSFPQVGG